MLKRILALSAIMLMLCAQGFCAETESSAEMKRAEEAFNATNEKYGVQGVMVWLALGEYAKSNGPIDVSNNDKLDAMVSSIAKQAGVDEAKTREVVLFIYGKISGKQMKASNPVTSVAWAKFLLNEAFVPMSTREKTKMVVAAAPEVFSGNPLLRDSPDSSACYLGKAAGFQPVPVKKVLAAIGDWQEKGEDGEDDIYTWGGLVLKSTRATGEVTEFGFTRGFLTALPKKADVFEEAAKCLAKAGEPVPSATQATGAEAAGAAPAPAVAPTGEPQASAPVQEPGVEAAVGYLKVRRADAAVYGEGTGFLIASDRLVTCLHVVEGAESAEISFPSGLSVPITGVLAEDAESDLVILALGPIAGAPSPLTLAPGLPAVGDRLALHGYHGGTTQKASGWKVTSIAPTYGMPTGIIMSTDASITHGFSGGPVLNDRREVVGVIRGCKGAWVFSGKELIPQQVTVIPVSRVTALAVGTSRSLREWTKARGAIAEAGIEVFRGDACAERDDWPTAISHYREAVRLDPSNYGAWLNLGVCLDKIGRKDEAVDTIGKALKLQPRFPEASRALADCYATQQGQYQKAADIYESLLRTNPNSDQDHLLLGLTYLQMGQANKAREQYETVKPTNPAGAEVLLGCIQQTSVASPSTPGSRAGTMSIAEIMKDAMASAGQVKPGSSQSLIKEISAYVMPSQQDIKDEAQRIRGAEQEDAVSTTILAFSGMMASFGTNDNLLVSMRVDLTKVTVTKCLEAFPTSGAEPSPEARYVYSTYVRIYAKLLYMAGQKDEAVRLWSAASQIGLKAGNQVAK